MATYSDSSFNSQHYNDARPDYPQSFYDTLIKYHDEGDAGREVAVDIGCGSGFVTFKLKEYFAKVIGTDPSDVMINQCKNSAGNDAGLEFVKGSAEAHPSLIKESSVGLLTGAECCHWVNHDAFFKESARVLKPNGTLAYWFYKDPVFVGFPLANETYDKYTYESDDSQGFEQYMGPYWQQPGRNYLRTLLKEIAVPSDLYHDVVRHEYTVDRNGNPTQSPQTSLSIRKKMTPKQFLGYVQSWSSYHSWMKDHGAKYDVAEKFIDELKHKLDWTDDTVIDVVWETVYTFARRN